jgi:hypothetical protein
VVVSDGARDALHAWLRVRGPATGPLLLPVDCHGHVRGPAAHRTDGVPTTSAPLAERAGVAAFPPP